MNQKIRIIILAAGKGVRMESTLPKVLAPLKGMPMIKHLLESIDETKIDSSPIIVVGYEKDLVINELGNKYTYAVQDEQLGTGHAVKMAEKYCNGAENVIVISGDQPFITSKTIIKLANKHTESGAMLTLTTTVLPDFDDWRNAFARFGRIIRNNGKIIIKEYKDATEVEKDIKEVNTSCYAFNTKWLWENLQKITRDQNAQKEYYLTDLCEIAGGQGDRIESMEIEPKEALGANTKLELEILENF